MTEECRYLIHWCEVKMTMTCAVCVCVCVCSVTLDIVSSSIVLGIFCNYYYFSNFYTELYFTGHTVYRNNV